MDFVLSLLIVLAICLASKACASRSESLDGEWDFVPDSDGKARKIRVPGCWQAQFPDLRDYVGRAGYRRRFSVPLDEKGRSLRLCFGAVDYFARVSVNDQVVGEHEGGYMPFEFDISGAVRFGEENALDVEVLDPAPGKPVGPFRFEEIPHGKQSWYGNVSGIWQSVWLEYSDIRRIVKLRVTPKADRSGVEVRTQIIPDTEIGCELRLSVVGPAGAPSVSPVRIGLEAGQEWASCEIPMPGALLWSPESPNLYQLKAQLFIEGQLVYENAATFGLRTIEAKDGKILLNGQPIYLRSALDQDFYPHTIYTPPSKEYLLDQFQKAKYMGLNCLRCHIKAPDPRYFDAADEIGLLIWYEIPSWMELTEESKRRGKETLRNMLDRDHNHPSLVIVGIVNEGWGVDLGIADHRDWLAGMYDYAKSLDRTRLIVDNSAHNVTFHVKTDINDYHSYIHAPDRADAYLSWIRDFAQRPKWAFSPHGDSHETGKEPLILSEFGIWGLPLVSKLRNCYGGEDPWWFRTALRSGRCPTRPEGVRERFEQQGLSKAFGDLDGLSTASQEQQLASLKYEIEQMRLAPEIQGYVITEFFDLHWESNGLLDMCRNPKVLFERSSEFQADCVVVCADGYVEVKGRNCSFIPRAAAIQSVPDDCTLIWGVEPLSSNATAVGIHREMRWSEVENRRIEFEIPNACEPAQYLLKMSLVTSDRKELARNSYGFCIYPIQTCTGTIQLSFREDSTALATSLSDRGWEISDEGGNVLICDSLNDAAHDFLESGRPVLLIARESNLPLGLPGVSVVERGVDDRWGDWCSTHIWFDRKGPFARAPYKGILDISLRDMVPSFVITGLDLSSPDVFSGIFVGWLHFPATLAAQTPLGNGKLFITTFPLERAFADGSPAAFVRDEVIRYLTQLRQLGPIAVQNTGETQF